jgi:mercuric ion transport protein
MTSEPKHLVPVVGASLGALGAAATAIAASLCCVGPAVVAILGTGGALAVARLERYRPYLLGAGAAVLAVGFVLAYRPGGTCRDGTCPRGAARFVRGTLWLSAGALAVAITLFFLGY